MSDYKTDHSCDSSVKDRICVPSDKVGRIIGKQGATIKRIMEDSRTLIDVTDELEGRQTVIKLTGGTLEDIEYAKRKISDLCKIDHEHRSPQNSTQQGCPVVEIWVPESKCGMIIGRKGSKISEIQSHTGTRVNVNSREKSEDGMCLVTISGDEASCKNAKEIVEGIVNRVSN